MFFWSKSIVQIKTDKFSTSQKLKKTTEKHPNHYKNTHFSFLCRRKNYILNAYAGVRILCSFYLFSTKKTPFSQSAFLLRILERQFNSINTCWSRLLISLLRWLWLLISLLLCRLLNLLSLLSLLISNFC